jgi:poly(hydroxyalkanoate) granule-associated protein
LASTPDDFGKRCDEGREEIQMVSKQKNTRRVTRTATANEATRKLWLAGLGAVSLAEKQGKKIIETLVEEGEQFKARTGKTTATLVKDVRRAANDAQKQVKGYVTPIKQRAQKAVKRIESNIGDTIGEVLGRFGVPSKSDVAELTDRVAELNKQVKSGTRKRAA